MKAFIFLPNISELPVEIASMSNHEVNFEMTRDIATPDNMNALKHLEGFRMFSYTDHISVYVKKSVVEDIVFI